MYLGEGNGNPLQCSCLENPTGRGAWLAMVHRVVELDTTEVTQHAQRTQQHELKTQSKERQNEENIGKNHSGMYLRTSFSVIDKTDKN